MTTAVMMLVGGGVALGLWGADPFDGSDDTVDFSPEDVPDDGAMLDPLPVSPSPVESEAGIACAMPGEQGPVGCEGWVLDHDGEVVGPLVAHEGLRTAYVGGDDGLHAVEVASGQLRWSARRVGAVSSSPAVGDEVLVVAAGDEVYGLHRNGRLRWSRALGAGEDGQQLQPSGRPHLVDDLVLVPAQQGAVAIKADSGARAWRIDHRAAVVSVATSEGLVVVHFIDGAIHAYDGGSGELVWEAPSRLVASDVALSVHEGLVFRRQ